MLFLSIDKDEWPTCVECDQKIPCLNDRYLHEDVEGIICMMCALEVGQGHRLYLHRLEMLDELLTAGAEVSQYKGVLVVRTDPRQFELPGTSRHLVREESDGGETGGGSE